MAKDVIRTQVSLCNGGTSVLIQPNIYLFYHKLFYSSSAYFEPFIHRVVCTLWSSETLKWILKTAVQFRPHFKVTWAGVRLV